jgi:hypothetical protein
MTEPNVEFLRALVAELREKLQQEKNLNDELKAENTKLNLELISMLGELQGD